jgi:hypothetical protein
VYDAAAQLRVLDGRAQSESTLVAADLTRSGVAVVAGAAGWLVVLAEVAKQERAAAPAGLGVGAEHFDAGTVKGVAAGAGFPRGAQCCAEIGGERSRSTYVIELEAVPMVGQELELAHGERVLVRHVAPPRQDGLAGDIVAGSP